MIAISYRREDSLPTAGRLYDRLQAKFGKQNVFMDFDSIPPGVDFREQIKQMIERSSLVIAIIGPHWLGEQPDASRRIDNPADFVRLEIAYALERGIPVIPVLVNNTPMPPPENLPQQIEGLAFRNSLVLDTGIDFHHHADRLITGISKALDVTPRSGAPRKVPKPTASAATTQPLRRIATWSTAILLTVAASAIWFLIVYHHGQEANGTRQASFVEPPKLAKAEPSVSPMEMPPSVKSETQNLQPTAQAPQQDGVEMQRGGIAAQAHSPSPEPVAKATPSTVVYGFPYVVDGTVVDSGSGSLAIQKGHDLWYFARTSETNVTYDIKPGDRISVTYRMVMPDMYTAFKTYSVTGTILDDKKAMVIIKKGADRWEISHELGREIGPTGKHVTIAYKMIALQVTPQRAGAERDSKELHSKGFVSASFVGKWTGTLRIETQDSYRGNNAKGDHRVLSESWIFEIPADQKTVSFHRAASTGPATEATLVQTSEDTLTWVEKTTASASVPYDEFDGNGRKIGTGVRIRDDYDATWTMHATSDTTASIVCESKRENIYAKITDAHITGTLKKN